MIWKKFKLCNCIIDKVKAKNRKSHQSADHELSLKAQSTISMIHSTITNYVYFSLFQNIFIVSVNLLPNSKKMSKVASTFPVMGGERHSNIMIACTNSCTYISLMVN